MKKKIMLLIVGGIFLVSCKNITDVPKLKDANDVILTVEDKNFTKQDYFKEDYITKGYDIALKELDKEWLQINYSTEKNETVKSKVEAARTTFMSTNATVEAQEAKYKEVKATTYEEYIYKNDELYKIQKEIAIKDYVNNEIISEKEIKKAYNNQEVGGNYRYILIAPDYSVNASSSDISKANNVAYKQAQDIIAKLKAKETFDSLATTYSDDALTKDKGGDLGYVSPSDTKLPTNMLNEMTGYKKDEYSKKPIQTKYGYVIVLKYQEATKKSYDEVKTTLFENKYKSLNSTRTGLEDYALVKLREDAKAKFSDPVFKEKYNATAKKIKNDYDFVPKTSTK